MTAEDRPRLELILRQNLLGTIAVSIVSLTFAVFNFDLVPRLFLVPWFTVLNVSVIYRIYLGLSWFKGSRDRLSDRAWWWRVRAALSVSGLAWGALGIAAPSFGSTTSIFAISAVCGMSGAALASYAPDLWSMYVILWPASLGFAIGQLNVGDGAHRSLAFLALVYATLLTRAGINVHRHVLGFLNNARMKSERDAFAAANDAKLTFLASASHEIRTPLAAINGYAESALEIPDLLPRARADFEVIVRNGRHLAAVVSDLLDLTRAEGARLSVHRDEVDPSRVVRECVETLRPGAGAKGLNLELTMTPLPALVATDATRLRQILLNLIGNAIKYTGAGSIIVSAEFGKSTLSVRVRDQGRGIAASDFERIFEPFARTDEREPGAGLGLAVARSLARRLGGDVRLVESVPDQGSTFEVYLAAEVIPRAAATSSPSAAANLGGYRVLIAEDDPDLRALMERALGSRGAAVTARDNGVDAVAAALIERFDVVLMDMKMPRLDGYDAAKQLRARGYRGSIVALTAYASAADEKRCLEAGCNRFVTKPVNFPELLGLIAELC